MPEIDFVPFLLDSFTGFDDNGNTDRGEDGDDDDDGEQFDELHGDSVRVFLMKVKG